MNILQKILGTIFPPYRFNVERKDGNKFYNALIKSLPDKYNSLKDQLNFVSFDSIHDWVLYPPFKFLGHFYSGESYYKLKKKGVDYRLSGIKIFSKKKKTYLELELLIHNNLPEAISIGNNDYRLDEFDLTKIYITNLTESYFKFNPDES